MFKKWTIKLSFVLMMCIGFASVTSASANAANNEVTVKLDGNNLQFDVSPKMMNNHVMVPMRVIFEALEATLKWEEKTQTVTAVTKNGDVLQLSIGSKNTWKNEGLVTIDTPPELINGRTFVPLRYVSESLGKTVKWEEATQTVLITPGEASNTLGFKPIVLPDLKVNKPDNKISDFSNTLDFKPITIPDFNFNNKLETKPETKPTIPVTTADEAYGKMIALKGQYPEGMTWTNDNYYGWQGGVYSGGYGCVGFAFILSDTVFGNLPARKHTDFDNIQVGDIVRVNNDSHSVVILSMNETTVTLAEGNYNSSIHWGRTLTWDKLKATGDYVMTRYPK
ncbi:copper amine oxidase N-terminal domain-containing protein [Paenibacillus sp. N1-5-1-14]|uniref:copper amine oxidase N-terminal domain-containing protein n=1 Tax=Paenibacillus radicibacter TaxID=2972488 RepID=UPI002159AC77|nr:copper amine oxidase N-terminal domain-containing protein [Paenibacillus radicibacter]